MAARETDVRNAKRRQPAEGTVPIDGTTLDLLGTLLDIQPDLEFHRFFDPRERARVEQWVRERSAGETSSDDSEPADAAQSAATETHVDSGS